MPYPITKNEKGEHCVNGKCYTDRKDALKYQRALYANVKDVQSKEFSEKCGWDDPVEYYGVAKLDPHDPEANYDPLRGGDARACANCRWFRASGARCDLVWGDIVATGMCDLWLKQPGPYTPEPIPVTVVNKEKPDSPIIAWLKRTFGKKSDEPLPDAGFKALPDNHWVSYYTNNFQDRTGEIFSERSHDQYIAALDAGMIPMPDLWYWHIPGTKHGQADWIDRVGHIVIAAGHFDDTPEAQLYRKEYESGNYRVSHSFGFPPGARQDGVYNAHFTVEISPLPAGKEANSITTFTEVKEMPVTDEKRQKLEAILGKDLANSVLSDAEKMSTELEKLGLKFKEAEAPATEPEKPTVDTDAREAIAAVAASSKQQFDLLTQLVNEIGTNVKQLTEAQGKTQTQTDQLIAGVKEMFELTPRASQSPHTVVDPKHPMAAFLGEKANGDQPAPKNVFEEIASQMLSSAKPPQSQS